MDGGTLLGWQQPYQGTAFGLPAPTSLRVPAPVPSSGSPYVIWGRAPVIFGFIFGDPKWRWDQIHLHGPGEEARGERCSVPICGQVGMVGLADPELDH